MYMTPFIFFNVSPSPFPFDYHHTLLSVSEFVCLLPLLYIPHLCEFIWFLSVYVWVISLCLILSRPIHVTTNGNISSFLGWVFHCIYIPHLIYPIIGWKTLKLFPYLDYYVPYFLYLFIRQWTLVLFPCLMNSISPLSIKYVILVLQKISF